MKQSRERGQQKENALQSLSASCSIQHIEIVVLQKVGRYFSKSTLFCFGLQGFNTVYDRKMYTENATENFCFPDIFYVYVGLMYKSVDP